MLLARHTSCRRLAFFSDLTLSLSRLFLLTFTLVAAPASSMPTVHVTNRDLVNLAGAFLAVIVALILLLIFFPWVFLLLLMLVGLAWLTFPTILGFFRERKRAASEHAGVARVKHSAWRRRAGHSEVSSETEDDKESMKNMIKPAKTEVCSRRDRERVVSFGPHVFFFFFLPTFGAAF